ncbi:hypothetical protein RUM43_010491 [Polyplax serrata]|uniref:Uncharacterized protein n=1 Tax=Polyplax serrata TaxID=468196 RepID=A0AAN8P0G6_POLSC
MQAPQGTNLKNDGNCLKLKRSSYGLKESPNVGMKCLTRDGKDVIEFLKKKFKAKVLGDVGSFLGMGVQRDQAKINNRQTELIEFGKRDKWRRRGGYGMSRVVKDKERLGLAYCLERCRTQVEGYRHNRTGYPAINLGLSLLKSSRGRYKPDWGIGDIMVRDRQKRRNDNRQLLRSTYF